MWLGQTILCKHNDKLQEGTVEKMFEEDVSIKLANNETITRKYWEVRVLQGPYNEKTSQK